MAGNSVVFLRALQVIYGRSAKRAQPWTEVGKDGGFFTSAGRDLAVFFARK